MFATIYQSLKQGYQQSWFKLFFRYTSLGKLITQAQEPSAFEFFNTYLSSWWWNRWWFKSCIESWGDKHQFDSILKCLQYLTDNGFFTEDNCLAVVNHANPYRLARALLVLQEAGILTAANGTLVANHDNPGDLVCALSYLEQAGILTAANGTLVAKHANPGDLNMTFLVLLQAGILTDKNFRLVANHANPIGLAHTLPILQEAKILTEAYFSLVANRDNPGDLNMAFLVLLQAGILTDKNFRLVVNHAKPYDCARALSYLVHARILTEANRTLVANHDNPWGLGSALSYLQAAGILTQLNFGALVAPNHAALVSQESVQLIWDRIPAHLLTQVNFNRLVMASEADNPMAALQRVTNQILGVEAVHAQAVHAGAFNPVQSTHTASVHRSVSASASRLMVSYGESLNLEAKIKEIKAYVVGLDDSPKHDAAKRCIARMTSADYAFTDSSGVSTRQLLALAWVAIHDETKCQATLEDAKALFVEGLYEIQRGYNLNAQGIDNQSPEDSPICSAGTFNKLMEKLNGIHSDVEVYYITHAGLGIKFPKVVAEHALSYLNPLSNPETATAYLSIKALLDSIKENGLGPIWDKIKSAVKAILWDEFKEAYGDNPEHPQFNAMIDNGHESNAPDLTELYAKLEASPGYQAFEESNPFLGLHQHGLWATHRENPEGQNVADGQCSLVPKP